jgi:hypothetical protein
MIIEIVLGLFILIEGYVIWNLIKKTEVLETWVETFAQRIEKTQNDLKEIDATGHFESDDEVGIIFDQIKSIVDELTELNGVEINESKSN